MNKTADILQHPKLKGRDAMKRDMDLVRAILLEIEEKGNPGLEKISIEGYSPNEINYALELLYESGLVNAGHSMNTVTGVDWQIRGLTWSGHDFVESARDNNRWNRAKDIVIKSGNITLDFFKQVLISLAQDQLNKILGLNPET